MAKKLILIFFGTLIVCFALIKIVNNAADSRIDYDELGKQILTERQQEIERLALVKIDKEPLKKLIENTYKVFKVQDIVLYRLNRDSSYLVTLQPDKSKTKDFLSNRRYEMKISNGEVSRDIKEDTLIYGNEKTAMRDNISEKYLQIAYNYINKESPSYDNLSKGEYVSISEIGWFPCITCGNELKYLKIAIDVKKRGVWDRTDILYLTLDSNNKVVAASPVQY